MRIPENKQYVLFGGAFVLANKLQVVADRRVQGLSTKQWFLLRNLQDLPAAPPPTITTLAREADTTRQNVTKMLELLQRQGYVDLRESPSDRRSQVVRMTPLGQQALRQVAGEAVPFFGELFEGIDPAQCAAAAQVVIQMIGNLQRMQEALEERERLGEE